MRFYPLLAGIGLLALPLAAQAQELPAAPAKPLVYTYVEQMPQFPGGVDSLRRFIGATVQYPAAARRKGVEGQVYVNFVVSAEGRVQDLKVLKGVHPLLDAEALRVIGAMPAWTPGRQSGKPVAVSYTIPLSFGLTPARPAKVPAPPFGQRP